MLDGPSFVAVVSEWVIVSYLRAFEAVEGALEELLGFLYAECCTRNKAIEPRRIAALCK